MADLHLDQHISPTTAALLTRHGHTVVTAYSLGMHKATDAEHLLHAAQHRRIVVSCDDDFLVLQEAWLHWPAVWQLDPLPTHAGVLVVPGSWPIPQVASEVNAFLRWGYPLTNVLYQYKVPRGQWVRH